MKTKKYKTNPKTDLPILPTGLIGERAKKDTQCSPEEILGRVIHIMEIYPTDGRKMEEIERLIMKWHHS